MITADTAAGISPEAWDELQAALERLSNGIQDRDAARRSRDRMEKMREENCRRFGVQDIAVDLIRESRDRR